MDWGTAWGTSRICGGAPPLITISTGYHMGNLSAQGVKNAGPGKYEDGEGLRLVVSSTGAKKWVMRITVAGKRREMGLGSYPLTSLAEARDKADAARKAVVKGQDPIAQRKVEMMEESPPAMPTFTQVAARYIRAHRHGWSNRKHARQWCATLKTYARPTLGKQAINTISTEEVLKVLTPIWRKKTETAKRVQGRMENIFDFAAAHKWRDPTNPARWRGNLDMLLPRPTRVQKVEHHPAMPYDEVPAFMEELKSKPGVSAQALQFLILTACRSGEVMGTQWSEIDLEARIWTIPAIRMKAKREHRVPLSPEAFAILQSLPTLANNPYVFYGSRGHRPISNMAMLQQMRGMGYGVGGNRGNYVPHGFRSSFRDWAGEVSSYPRDVCEMALAHVIENKVEAAYRRGDLFVKRRKMMEEWAAWCTQSAPEATSNET